MVMNLKPIKGVKKKLLMTNHRKKGRRWYYETMRKSRNKHDDEVRFIETVIENIATTRRLRTAKSSDRDMYLVYKNKTNRSKSINDLEKAATATDSIENRERHASNENDKNHHDYKNVNVRNYRTMSLSNGLNNIRYSINYLIFEKLVSLIFWHFV